MTITCYAKCPHANACNAAGLCLWPVEPETGQPAPAHRDLTELEARAIVGKTPGEVCQAYTGAAELVLAALAPELAVVDAAKDDDEGTWRRLREAVDALGNEEEPEG